MSNHMKDQIVYPIKLKMSEVRTRYIKEFGYPPTTVIHSKRGWIIEIKNEGKGVYEKSER